MNAKKLSFCVGPHFFAEPNGDRTAWTILCQGKQHGQVEKSASGEEFVLSEFPGEGSFKSIRAAGIALLRIRNVISRPEGATN